MSVAKLTARSMSALKDGIEATHRQFLEVAGLRKIDRQAAERLIQHSELLLRRNVIPLGQDLAVRTEEGYLLIPAEDPALLIAVVETGNRLEPGTHAVALSILRENDVLIDVGASIGTFTLPAARRVGAGGFILAVEPTPRSSSLLRRTVTLNYVSDWVEVQECAAGETSRTDRFALSQRTSHNSLLPPEDTLQTIDVTVRRLDDLIAAGRPVNLVKIDVEGAELQVWRGMRRIVAENPGLAVILEFGPEHLRRGGVTADAWFKEITASGHTAWEIDEATGTVRPLRTSGLEELYTLNILLIRDHPHSRGLRVI